MLPSVDWHIWAEVIAVLGGVAVSLRWLWTYIPRLYYKVRRNMFGIGDLKNEVGALKHCIEQVVVELRPNGGASIRDSLNRIELRQVLQEQRQKAILSDMSVGVFEADTQGNYVWVNRKYLRMTGRAPSEVNGSGWINTVAESDRERVLHDWHEAIKEDREFETEYIMYTREGTTQRVALRTYRMSTDDHEPLGFMGMVTPADEPLPDKL